MGKAFVAYPNETCVHFTCKDTDTEHLTMFNCETGVTGMRCSRSMMLNVWRNIRRSVQRLERTSRITSQSIALDSMCHFAGQASRLHTLWYSNMATENSPFINDFPSYNPEFIGEFHGFPASHVWWHQRVSTVSAPQVKHSVLMQRLKSCKEKRHDASTKCPNSLALCFEDVSIL